MLLRGCDFRLLQLCGMFVCGCTCGFHFCSLCLRCCVLRLLHLRSVLLRGRELRLLQLCGMFRRGCFLGVHFCCALLRRRILRLHLGGSRICRFCSAILCQTLRHQTRLCSAICWRAIRIRRWWRMPDTGRGWACRRCACSAWCDGRWISVWRRSRACRRCRTRSGQPYALRWRLAFGASLLQLAQLLHGNWCAMLGSDQLFTCGKRHRRRWRGVPRHHDPIKCAIGHCARLRSPTQAQACCTRCHMRVGRHTGAGQRSGLHGDCSRCNRKCPNEDAAWHYRDRLWRRAVGIGLLGSVR